MSLAQKIHSLLKGVLNNSDDITSIVNHLISEDIGVTKLSELSEVTLEILPQSVKIPFIKRKPLLEAFAKCTSDTTTDFHNNPSTSSAENPSTSSAENPSTSSAEIPNFSRNSFRSTENVIPDQAVFSFKVPWAQMPKAIMENLKNAKEKQIKANPQDVDALKLAIAKKLKAAYVSHREIYPGLQKSPGRKIYAKVIEEIEEKFGNAVKTTVKNVVLSSGTSNLFYAFETCMENLLKDTKNSYPKSHVSKGKKVIGVDPDSYQPIMTSASKEVQQGIKDHLVNIKLLDTDQVDWPLIIRNMKETYELQREQIVLGTVNLSKNNESEQLDDPEQKLLARLKEEWPFLFEMKCLEIHHLQLTKRDLGTKMKIFIDELLDLSLAFMTTCTKCNVENLKIRLKLERRWETIPTDVKLMSLVHMVANNFGESFDHLFLPAERTSQLEEIPHTILEEKKDPCIVALDSNIYAAEKYIVCADQIPLIEVSSPKDAFVGLVEACFVFDLEYPPQLPRTMEFFERYVFDMGVLDTKCKKKGRQLIVMSEAVKKLITSLEEFGDVLKNSME